MNTHGALVVWRLRDEDDFLAGHYSRAHTISFDGWVTLAGSASPRVVHAPWSVEAAADPEELFVSALSACHMLWFLDFARRAGFICAAYRDPAEGTMGEFDGRIAVVKVTLRPVVGWRGERRPTEAELGELHRKAHECCFIANSVRTEVVVEPGEE